ncbi:hypothetical protein ACFPRL_23160 [Pseudoclavibacter helvolus]
MRTLHAADEVERQSAAGTKPHRGGRPDRHDEQHGDTDNGARDHEVERRREHVNGRRLNWQCQKRVQAARVERERLGEREAHGTWLCVGGVGLTCSDHPADGALPQGRQRCATPRRGNEPGARGGFPSLLRPSNIARLLAQERLPRYPGPPPRTDRALPT